MRDLSDIKDPVLRAKVENVIANPSGEVAAELSEQDMEALAGAGIKEWYEDFSSSLGNKGRFCTVTKECMNCCN